MKKQQFWSCSGNTCHNNTTSFIEVNRFLTTLSWTLACMGLWANDAGVTTKPCTILSHQVSVFFSYDGGCISTWCLTDLHTCTIFSSKLTCDADYSINHNINHPVGNDFSQHLQNTVDCKVWGNWSLNFWPSFVAIEWDFYTGMPRGQCTHTHARAHTHTHTHTHIHACTACVCKNTLLKNKIHCN